MKKKLFEQFMDDVLSDEHDLENRRASFNYNESGYEELSTKFMDDKEYFIKRHVALIKVFNGNEILLYTNRENTNNEHCPHDVGIKLYEVLNDNGNSIQNLILYLDDSSSGYEEMSTDVPVDELFFEFVYNVKKINGEYVILCEEWDYYYGPGILADEVSNDYLARRFVISRDPDTGKYNYDTIKYAD